MKLSKHFRKGFALARRQIVGFPDPLVFLHNPKTGGTSVDAAVARFYEGAREPNVGFTRNTRAWLLMKAHEGREDIRWTHVMNTALCYQMAGRAPYLSGHFCVSRGLIDATRPPHRFVTILRDPVERWISLYIYSRIRMAQDGQRAPPDDIAEELERYLTSDSARREGARYVFSLGGHQRDERLFERDTVELAKDTLAAFDAVGFLDRLGAFEARLSQLLNRNIEIPHLRKTHDFREPGGRRAEDYQQLFCLRMRERVAEICAPDQEIHDFARKLPNAC